MNILLIGKNGQVGWELQRTLATLGQVHSIDFPEIDLRDVSDIRSTIRAIKPNLIVNAAAYTDVDRAEKEPDQAYAINSTAPGILAEEAYQIGAGLVHYSTDFVFDGEKKSPYTETDKPNPINTYGKSKFDGDRAIEEIGARYLILRTSWVYSSRRECFVTKVLRWVREHPSLEVVSDQIGNPTWCRILAELTAQVLRGIQGDADAWFEEYKGVYHVAGSGNTNRFEWAQAIIQSDPYQDEHISEIVLPAQTSDFKTPAQRPLYSALNSDRFCTTFSLTIPHWEESLRMAMENCTPH